MYVSVSVCIKLMRIVPGTSGLEGSYRDPIRFFISQLSRGLAIFGIYIVGGPTSGLILYLMISIYNLC